MADEEISVKVINDTAFDIVKIDVFHESVQTHNWQGALLSSINGGRYEPVLFSFPKDYFKSGQAYAKISIQYISVINGNLFSSVIEKSINVGPSYPGFVNNIYIKS